MRAEPSFHQMSLFVAHGLQMYVGFLLHDHRAHLVFVQHAVRFYRVVFARRLLWHCSLACIEIRVVSFHAHLTSMVFKLAHTASRTATI